jgi:outer membrane protein assembly factor BamB
MGSPAFKPTAGQPVGWRGDGSGQFPAANPPTVWSEKKNIVWKTDVGAGFSSPVLVGDRVLITTEPDLLICLDAASGKELWRKAHKTADFPAAVSADPPPKPHEHGDATPAPVSDGKSVWVFIGTGIVACYDLDGTRRWSNWYDMSETTGYGRTASPVLVGGRLLVHFGPLVCLDAATGKVLWQADRARASYGTPAVTRIGGVDVAITAKGDVVRVSDGKILADGLGNCGYPSPIVEGGVAYFIDRKSTAVRLPEKAGEKIECKELWYEDLDPNGPPFRDFYASPLLIGGRIYTVDRDANYYVLDAGSGKSVLQKTLALPPAGAKDGPNIYASPCLAGKLLFLSNDAGETLLLEPGDRLTVVGSNSLPNGSGGTPTFSGKRMFVRGGNFLYCIGQ